MEIRRAGIEDAKNIVSNLWMPLGREMESITDYNTLSNNAEQKALEHRRDTLENEEGICLIAENNEELIGLISVSIQERAPIFEENKYVKVHDLYVKEKFRSQGVAKKLFERAEKWASNQNVEAIELNVDTPNKAAINFYEKQGFGEIRKKMRKKL